jgi:hypothetical protein
MPTMPYFRLMADGVRPVRSKSQPVLLSKMSK